MLRNLQNTEVENLVGNIPCKKCIDEDKMYCADIRYYGYGRCCDTFGDPACMINPAYNHCSQRFSSTEYFVPPELEYTVCPNSYSCDKYGQRELFGYDYFTGTLRAAPNSVNEICTYTIKGRLYGWQDYLWIEINHTRSMNIVVIHRNKEAGYKIQVVGAGKKFGILANETMYVIAKPFSQHATFDMAYWVAKGPLEDTLSPVDPEPPEKNETIPDDD